MIDDDGKEKNAKTKINIHWFIGFMDMQVQFGVRVITDPRAEQGI